MNELQIFNHEEFGEIRTIEIDGQIYFVGVDVARALEYKDPSSAVSKRVKEHHRKKVMIPHCQNGKVLNFSMTSVVDESGVYSLVLASKCKGAEPFQEWVTAEVLPSIRRTGAYGNAISDERIYKKLEALEQKMNVLEKKIDAFEKNSDNRMNNIINSVDKTASDSIETLNPCFYSLDRKIGSVTQTIINAVKGNAKLLAVYIEYLLKRK